MAVRIKFNGEHMPQQPTFVLANRNGNKLGTVPAIGINFRDDMNSASELQFRVPMKENGVVCPLWDDIVDFKLLWCPEWDQWFEINVEISDGDIVEKNVSAKSVGEAELSQINLYEIEINTEDDIARDDYVTTVLYDPNNPEGSLLDRITEKAPHYSIGHVDATIVGLQRTFTFDGVSILDALYEIAEEINCLFVVDSGSKSDGSIAREINAYDLYSNCTDCGYRGEYQDACPECGSTLITPGYGSNTNIYVSVENLTDDIGYSSNTDQVKNCFRLVGGDDLMTATIRNCNPNGTNYIWHFSDAMKADMSDELRAGIEAYNTEYDAYMHSHAYTIPNAIRTDYNALVTKYSVYVPTLASIPATIYGYSNLMNAMYDTIDFEMLLRNTLMPTPQMTPTSAAIEAAKLTTASLSPTAVTNLASCSASTASSAVLDVAKQIVDDAYQVKSDIGTLRNNVWTGSLTVKNYSDDEDTAATGNISVTITDDMEAYLKQRINKVLSQKSDNVVDIPTLFKSDLATFMDEIKKYCLASLNSMRDICQSCIDILIEQGVADNRTWGNTTPNLYNIMYIPYMNKLNALVSEVALREREIAVICGAFDENGGVVTDGAQTVIQKLNGDTQKYLNMQTRLGPDLVNELAAYRREDTYENTNYISDGLDNREVFKRAMEFIDEARNEIYKSATLQHSITSNLRNLLVIKEFEPIVEAFEIGNWITISVAGKTYRLRMISYDIDFDNLENINVEFSDVVETLYGRSDAASILRSASSMSTSYDAVKRQASAGQQSKNVLGGFVSSGLALTQMKIINDAENQNVTMDHHGLLCREYLPYDDTYDGQQLKVINKGLYLTDDGWQTSKAGIGQFTYYDPEDGLEKTSYGVIADLLMSNLILSEKVGIYNKNGRIKLDQDGFTLVSCNDGTDRTVFRIQRKNGNNVENVIYFDDNGNAHFNGNLDAASGTFTGTLDASCINTGTLSAERIGANSIAVGKLTGSISNNNWVLNLTDGTFTIGNISADNINAGTLSADRIGAESITSAMISTDGITANKIKGGTLTLGGSDNVDGSLLLKDANGNSVGTLDKDGYTTYSADMSSPSEGDTRSNTSSGEFVLQRYMRDGSSGQYRWKNMLRLTRSDNAAGIVSSDYLAMISEEMMHIGTRSEVAAGIRKDSAYARFSGWQSNGTIELCAKGHISGVEAGDTVVTITGDNTAQYTNQHGSVNITGQLNVGGNHAVTGALTVSGTKSRVLPTDQYSDRLLYCYETPSPMFGDVGEGVIGEDCRCYIWLDPVFAQTISTDQYQVFLQSYGDGQCWVAERHPNYFIVEGLVGIRFGWEIKAKQRDYDQRRLDKNDTPFTVPAQTYGEDAAQHIADIEKERMES